ncbi:MAG: hypothetical protein KF830_17815 [Planctomycetes bacterium]|nr:hypothetical protein [Planctomycetota bacterium]
MRHSASRVLFAAAALACSASAQTITWGPVLPSLAPSDVSINGALVYAGNAHQPNVTPIPATVNGVTFVGGFHPTSWNGYIVGGLNGSTTGNAEYDKLLANSLAMQTGPAANPTGWGGIRLDTLATLTPGYLYEIQVWFTDQRTGSPTNVLYDRVMTLSSAFGTATLSGGEITNLGAMLQGPLSGPLEADPDNAPAASSPDTVFGSHCTGQFVFDPSAETWLIVQGTHPNPTNVLAPHITALQIRDLSSASHQNYGTGCHTFVPADATNCLQQFAGSPAAKAALDGNAVQFLATPTGYVAIWLPGGGATFVPPGGGALPGPTLDDQVLVITPSAPIPVPGGVAAQWAISSNGILTAGSVGNQGTSFSPSLAATATATGLAWYVWRDWSPHEAGSGPILYEEIGGVLYVTWNGVEAYPIGGTPNPGTWQFQVDMATGNVAIVVVSFEGGTSTANVVVGCTLAGAGPVPPSIDLATQLPFVLDPIPPGSLQPLTLSAAPAPVINPSTLVTYTIGNIPEFVPASGVYLSTLFLSLNPLPGGLELAGLLTTVPGCRAHIATLDLNLGTALTLAPSNAVPVTFATPAFAPGNVIAAQAVALFDAAFPLVNGEAGGFLVSNGVRSTTQPQ